MRNYIYLYGQNNEQNKDIVLARVPVAEAEFFKNYEFWTGFGWSTDVYDCQPVMRRIEHGQIFPTTIFGKHSEYKYCFIGCSSDGDSRVLMSRTKSPEGPWNDGYILDMKLYKSDTGWYGSSPFMYCMYPHPVAFGFNTKTGLERTGDLMIIWSEGGMRGGVLAACARFQMEEVSLTYQSDVAVDN